MTTTLKVKCYKHCWLGNVEFLFMIPNKAVMLVITMITQLMRKTWVCCGPQDTSKIRPAI